MFNYLIFVNTIIFDFLFGSSGRSFFLGVFLVFLGFLIFGLFFNFGDSGRFGSLEGLVFFFIFGRLFCSGILFCSGRFGWFWSSGRLGNFEFFFFLREERSFFFGCLDFFVISIIVMFWIKFWVFLKCKKILF